MTGLTSGAGPVAAAAGCDKAEGLPAIFRVSRPCRPIAACGSGYRFRARQFAAEKKPGAKAGLFR